MYVWGKLLLLLAAIHVASGTWVKGTGIKYFLATCGRQNCDTVCGTFGFQCARTGQSFPPTSALSIFESLGISCKSFNTTDYYKYEDHPNFVAESSTESKEWVGVCLGFKSIPSTIDCHTANNTYVRRLCPCYDSSVPQQPATTSLELSTTTKRTTTTAAATTADVTASSTTTTTAATTADVTASSTTTTTTTTAATTADVIASSTTTTTDATTADDTASSTTTTTTAAATTAVTATTTKMPHGTSIGTAKPPRTTATTTITTSETEKTTSEVEVTTGIDNATVEAQSTGKDIGTGLPREQAATSGDAERTALIVVAVIAAGLVICLLSLVSLLMWKRKQLRGKRGKRQDSETIRVGYHKNNNKMAVPDMIDGLTVVAGIEEENSYCDMKSIGRSLQKTKGTKVKSLAEDESYENTFEQASENILYSSISEGTNMAFAADNNIPLYDRLA